MNKEIINTLLYFDIFKYPLTKVEIRKYISLNCSESDIEVGLSNLLEEGKIFSFGDFYSLHNNQSTIDERLKSNQLAKSSMPKAIKIAKRIQKFPFVLSVNLSGSISKDVMHPDSDLDFFVITEKNRLWVAKLFLVLFKRLFLLNRKEDFCINYFISVSDLRIHEKNIFTAIELTSLKPVSGQEWHSDLLKANPWIKEYCKNCTYPSTDTTTKISKPLWSRLISSTLNGTLGDKLEKRVMKRVYESNKKKFSKGLSKEEFELMFRSDENQAKVHNSNHQSKILDLYAEKIENFESRINIPISENN